MGFEVGYGVWICGFWVGFVWLMCVGIYMVYIWVDSSVFVLFNDGLIFGLWIGVGEILVFEV